MALIVQKYGGSSVAGPERIRHVARRIAGYRARGDQVVAVVSAMGGETDRLAALARGVSEGSPPRGRELDMLLSTGEQTTIALLAMALHSLGVEAASLTGAQAGITTDGVHTRARIRNITPGQVHRLLDQGQVVIVAGFQGKTPEGHITTLGRGGSDLTAIAMAAAMEADLCQIYTDVDGVHSADPRQAPRARKIDEISYDEMLELAGSGARVMQSRAVEFAKKFGIRFEVRSSLNSNPGTMVKEETAGMEQVVVRGVTLDENQAKITLVGVPDRPGIAARIFQTLHQASISVDLIVQNVAHGEAPRTDISFTVERSDLERSREVIASLAPEIAYSECVAQEEMGKLSIVGVGMRSHSGIAARLFEALAGRGINIDMISTSEIKVSVVIALAQAKEALGAVHRAFLEPPPGQGGGR